jgi:YHS domain-containing protein
MKDQRANSTAHRDPICGRSVAEHDLQGHSAEYKRRRYFFCSEHCRDAFAARAERLRLAELARLGALMAPNNIRWGLA